MRTEPRFVKPDDYYNYTGKELSKMLKLKDNESNMTNIFLMQIEDKLLARIDAVSFRTTPWDKITEFQKENLQKAIILETEYIIRNGDLFTDSGYDLERGQIIDFSKLQAITICQSSVDLLIQCGLYNHVIGNKKRHPMLF